MQTPNIRLRKTGLAFALVALIATLGPVSFGQIYVVTNDDNPSGNTATVFSLDTGTGVLTQVKVLSTGGTGLGAGFFAATSQAIQQSATCIFLADTGSNDIAAFSKAKGFAKIGNFSNSHLNFSATGQGGSLALTPNGKFLYGTYSGSRNVGAWTVNADCSLTYLNAYVPHVGKDTFSPVKVDPQGTVLVVPAPDLQAAEAFKINTNGSLADADFVSWAKNSTCQQIGCYPTGLDITADSATVIFGNATFTNNGNYVLTATLSPTQGLINPQVFSLANSTRVGNCNVPWLSKQAYSTGSGPLYLGMSGYENPIVLPGMITANFNEQPQPNITATNATALTDTPYDYEGAIRSIDSANELVVAVYPNLIYVEKINPDGSFTTMKENTDRQGVGLLSLDIFPNGR